MMRHSKAIEYLEGYGPGELSPALQEQLDAHVGGCPECGAMKAEALSFQSLLATGVASRTPAGFETALERVRHRTLAEVRNADSSPNGVLVWLRSLSFRPATAVLASAALLAFAFLIQPLSKDSSDIIGLSPGEGPVLRLPSSGLIMEQVIRSGKPLLPPQSSRPAPAWFTARSGRILRTSAFPERSHIILLIRYELTDQVGDDKF